MYTLITGASSGIGRQLSIDLSVNSNLILAGRDISKLEETKEMCHGESHKVWQVDFSDIENIENSFSLLQKRLEYRINKFVHSAGYVRSDPIRQINFSEINQHFSINVFSAVELVRLLISRKQNESQLTTAVFVSSIFSAFGASGHTLYSSSKGALDSAMRSMAAELAPKTRVNSLQLGAIFSEMSKDSLQNLKLEDQYPLGIGNLQNASDALQFLLSEQSSWITGQALIVDGGRTSNASNIARST